VFKEKLHHLSSLHIPTKFTKSRTDLPWLTPKILRQIRKRDKLYTKIKKSHHANPTLSKSFKALKYSIQKQIRLAYWSYLESVIFSGDSQSNSNKKFYSYVKQNKTENCGVAPLKDKGLTFTDPVDKANILNKQFESVFSKPQPLSLKQMCRKIACPKSTPEMPEISISVEGVDKLLLGLSPNKACGPDEISPRILKELHHEISPILTKIFKLSFETGIVPPDWKSAVVAPIYKKGPKSKASNYRPISLTCIASKIMEHILVSNIMTHYDNNNLLSQYQHGFRSKHSCETQLISFTQEVFDNLENGKQTDVIVMDFSKAFDKVDHNKLIHKLDQLGVHPLASRWIKSFLKDRTQRVVVDGCTSDTLPVLSGVPQGSVLGPCLFLSYINDLPDSIKSKARLFADDTIVYLTVKSSSDSETLQNDLTALERWERDWSMEFNPDKCEVLRITRKKNPIIFPYLLHGTELKSTDAAKYLGVTISKDLNWSPHINNVTSKAKNSLRFIRRNVKTNNKEIKTKAYNTYVRPQLEYCSSVWHPWQKTLTRKIEMINRLAARYVCNNYDYTSSVSHMIKTLNWQTLEQRRHQTSLIVFYKIKYNLVNVDHHHLTPTRNLSYLIPHSRTQYFSNSFFPRTIRLWNTLPSQVQSSPSLQVYAERLSTVPLI
jgi:hypothetical protein